MLPDAVASGAETRNLGFGTLQDSRDEFANPYALPLPPGAAWIAWFNVQY
jgi:hypothetical protein